MIICYWNGTSKLNSPGVLDLLTPKVDSYPSDFLSSVPREVLHPWQCHHGSPSRPGTVPLWSLAVPWRRTSNARADSIIHENQTMELCSEWRVNFWYAGGVPTFLSLVFPKPGLPQSGKWHRTSKSHWMDLWVRKRNQPQLFFLEGLLLLVLCSLKLYLSFNQNVHLQKLSALGKRASSRPTLDADLRSIIQTLGQDSGLGMVSVGANG